MISTNVNPPFWDVLTFIVNLSFDAAWTKQQAVYD